MVGFNLLRFRADFVSDRSIRTRRVGLLRFVALSPPSVPSECVNVPKVETSLCRAPMSCGYFLDWC